MAHGRPDVLDVVTLPEPTPTPVYDWVIAEGVRNHPGTVWFVRVYNSHPSVRSISDDYVVEIGTVFASDGDYQLITNHINDFYHWDDVSYLMRYYAGGMVDDLGATLDTCYTAYDVVAAVCNHLVTTGCDPFDIDGEMVAMMMYPTPITKDEFATYAEAWYTSLPAGDDATGDGVRCGVCGRDVSDTDDGWCDCLHVATTDDDDAYCRGCGCEISFPVSYVYDDDWYCGLCYTDMVRNSE